MNWNDAVSEIESPDFDAKLNVISGMDAFFRGVAKEPVVLEAYRCLQDSGQAREDALNRLCDLSALEIDVRYENPNDTVLAVLLWLFSFTYPDDVGLAVDYVSRAPQCWYAAKFAKQLAMLTQVEGKNEYVGVETYNDKWISKWDIAKDLKTGTVNVRPVPSCSKVRVREVRNDLEDSIFMPMVYTRE